MTIEETRREFNHQAIIKLLNTQVNRLETVLESVLEKYVKDDREKELLRKRAGVEKHEVVKGSYVAFKGNKKVYIGV